VCAAVNGAMASIVVSGEAAALTEEDRRVRTYKLMLRRLDLVRAC
jgi:hypothetical protein